MQGFECIKSLRLITEKHKSLICITLREHIELNTQAIFLNLKATRKQTAVQILQFHVDLNNTEFKCMDFECQQKDEKIIGLAANFQHFIEEYMGPAIYYQIDRWTLKNRNGIIVD